MIEGDSPSKQASVGLQTLGSYRQPENVQTEKLMNLKRKTTLIAYANAYLIILRRQSSVEVKECIRSIRECSKWHRHDRWKRLGVYDVQALDHVCFDVLVHR